MGWDRIFRVVRRAAGAVLGRERYGLSLALADLPPGLGAYWPVAGNFIVLNQGMVDLMRRRGTPQEFNSFAFVVLTHEYLHTLGFLDEVSARRLTARVARACFGKGHPATRMAEGDLWTMYPEFASISPGDGRRLRPVRDFDRAATDRYIR
ncbi:MAG: hypothetical protein ACYCPN_03885 [Thermoplasmata archaeon]